MYGIESKFVTLDDGVVMQPAPQSRTMFVELGDTTRTGHHTGGCHCCAAAAGWAAG